jgi:ABC-type uncharacterized transport system permease subunit
MAYDAVILAGGESSSDLKKIAPYDSEALILIGKYPMIYYVYHALAASPLIDSWLIKVAVPIASILLAILVGWIFLALSGYEAAETYRRMFYGAFGSAYNISETIVKAIPLALAGLAVSVAFRMKLWNIGAEGQLYMGAFAAGGVVMMLGDWPSILLLPLMMVAGFIAGALWGFIPGVLRALWNVNETITSLLLNYVAIAWVGFWVFGPWKDPNAMGFPLAPRFPEAAYLPVIPGSRVHIGILVAILVAIVLYIVLKYTRWGYEVRVTGESQEAARYAGMDVAKNIILVMLISGGIAGITGMIEVSGITHQVLVDREAGRLNYKYIYPANTLMNATVDLTVRKPGHLSIPYRNPQVSSNFLGQCGVSIAGKQFHPPAGRFHA